MMIIKEIGDIVIKNSCARIANNFQAQSLLTKKLYSRSKYQFSFRIMSIFYLGMLFNKK